MATDIMLAALLDGRGFIMTLVIGGLAGWLAGQITRRRGFGVIRNILIGILGSILGGLVFGLLGLSAYGFLGQTIMATIGAILLIYIINAVVAKGR